MASKRRTLSKADLDRLRFDFDPTSDTLFVYCQGVPVPSINVVVDDYLSYRVDPETQDVVGFHIDDFLYDAVRHVPSYRVIADLLDLPSSTGKRPWRDLTAEQRRRVAAELLAGSLLRHGG